MLKKFRTYQIAIELHQLTQNITLKPPYQDQFERAMLSVVLNLAEGSAKPTAKDRRRFYFIAFGSLREVQCIVDLLNLEELKAKTDELAAHLYKLCNA